MSGVCSNLPLSPAGVLVRVSSWALLRKLPTAATGSSWTSRASCSWYDCCNQKQQLATTQLLFLFFCRYASACMMQRSQTHARWPQRELDAPEDDTRMLLQFPGAAVTALAALMDRHCLVAAAADGSLRAIDYRYTTLSFSEYTLCSRVSNHAARSADASRCGRGHVQLANTHFPAVVTALVAVPQSDGGAESADVLPSVIAGFASGVVRLLRLCTDGWHTAAAVRLHEGMPLALTWLDSDKAITYQPFVWHPPLTK